MSSADPETHDKVIIIRRSVDNGEEEHHSGVWKIAYADFMTAMMAFFLVMWLINTIDEDTRAAVANYFNPLKLVDTKSRDRGIVDLKIATPSGEESLEKSLQETGNTAVQERDAEQIEESKLMAFPYQILDGISDEGSRVPEGRGGASAGGMQLGSAEGTAHRDPFSPEYRDKSPVPDGAPADADTNPPVNSYDAMPSQTGQQEKAEENPAAKAETADSKAELDKKTNENKSELAKPIDTRQTGPVEKAFLTELSDKIRSDIEALLHKEAVSGAVQPQIQVTAVENGIMIELTDSQNYGMFAVGSAKPDRELISVLEGVAKILQNQKGEVIISGHTDARPYKTKHYDNWQLSSARAQMAYYMLVRGGLDESRMLRVEGYADRDLKNSKDSYAAENRRIAIFLKLPQTEAH